MELRQLRYFVAVAEELNFTRAAARVGIAQPPLSQQIRALEQDLGVSLFTRNRRQVALTEPGRIFLVHARRTLKCAEEARAATSSTGEGLRGTLSVAAIYTAAYSIVPRILRGFRESFPDVTVQLREMSIAEQQAALRAGSIDIGLLRPPLLDDGLDFVTLFREPLMAAIPARHRLRQCKTVSLADLAAEPFVSLPTDHAESLGSVSARMFARRGLKVRVVQQVGEMHTLLCLVASGLGVSVVPASVADIRLRDVAYRPIDVTTPLTPVCLASARNPTSLVVPHFIASVKAAFAEPG